MQSVIAPSPTERCSRSRQHVPYEHASAHKSSTCILVCKPPNHHRLARAGPGLLVADAEGLDGFAVGVGKQRKSDFPSIGKPFQYLDRIVADARSEKIVLGPDSELSIGRDPDCGLTVDNKHVSRLHARIFHRQGKFFLEDQSANGTFLVPQYSKLHLLREESILHGSGLIYLGADPDTTHSEPILYAVP